MAPAEGGKTIIGHVKGEGYRPAVTEVREVSYEFLEQLAEIVSASSLTQDKIRGWVNYKGILYCVTGMVSSGVDGIIEVNGARIVHVNHWVGPTYTASQLINLVRTGVIRRGHANGHKVANLYDKRLYVLTGEVITWKAGTKKVEQQKLF